MQFNVRDLIFWFTLALFISLNAWCTLTNRNIWPFYSMDVFNEAPRSKVGHWLIRFSWDQAQVDLDPGEVLPLEFFAARGFLGFITQSEDEERIEKILDYIFKTVREERAGFDERWKKPALAPKGPGKVQIVLRVMELRTGGTLSLENSTDHVMAEKKYEF